MNHPVLASALLALAGAAGCLWAQQPQPAKPAPPSQPVSKQPQPKSKGEADALMAIFNTQDVDVRIKAAEELLTKYVDTEFKTVALQIIAASYQQKNDFEKMVIYAERTLESDPNNYVAMLMLASAIPQRTREFDLDREEKLARAEKFARSAEEIMKTAPKPRPDIPDEQWAAVKKDFSAQAHEALGLAAMVRKKYDVAIAEFKTAIETAPNPDPTVMVRLGAVYNLTGKYDEGIALLDKVMAATDVHPQLRQFAQAERVRAIQAKTSGAKPAAPAAPSTTAPAQVEIKRP